jgi:phosphoglycolate phosphatase-like HAD superfamily hydrolase
VGTRSHLKAVAVALDALGDTGSLWRDWLEEARRRYRVDPGELERQLPNWRALLERFAEERAPVYLRPDAEVSTALRQLQSAGTAIAVFADAPVELARVVLSQLGAARRIELLETGPGALERIRERLGTDVTVVESRRQLLSLR